MSLTSRIVLDIQHSCCNHHLCCTILLLRLGHGIRGFSRMHVEQAACMHSDHLTPGTGCILVLRLCWWHIPTVVAVSCVVTIPVPGLTVRVAVAHKSALAADLQCPRHKVDSSLTGVHSNVLLAQIHACIHIDRIACCNQDSCAQQMCLSALRCSAACTDVQFSWHMVGTSGSFATS